MLLIYGSGTKLTPAVLDQISADQSWFNKSQPELDLRAFSFITPPAMTQLAAICASLAKSGYKPPVFFNNSGMPLYLFRCGCLDIMKEHARPGIAIPSSWRNPNLERYGKSQTLIEMEQLEGIDQLDGLIGRMITVLMTYLGFAKYDAYRVAQVISEVAQNPFEHSAGTTGFFTLQAYSGQRGRFLQIGMSDCGSGITATLANNPDNPIFPGDADAIQFATAPGASGVNGDVTRGKGLAHLVDTARTLGGSARIRSGQAAVTFSGTSRRKTPEMVCRIPGVHLSISLPASSIS